MKTIKNTLPVIISSLLISLMLVSCSDDKPETKSYDHAHSQLVNMDLHPFEHEFAKQCINREIKDSVNKSYDSERFAKPCMCIAERVFDGLTPREADRFLREKEHTQKMRIKYEAAAYKCLQQNQPKVQETFKSHD